MALAGALGMPFSSETYAWQQTEDHSFSNDTETSAIFPSNHLLYGSAATTGVIHGWRLTPDGFGLVIDVMAGSNWVVVAKPRNNSDIYADINIFMVDFDCYNGNCDRWDLEGIVLRAGNCL